MRQEGGCDRKGAATRRTGCAQGHRRHNSHCPSPVCTQPTGWLGAAAGARGHRRSDPAWQEPKLCLSCRRGWSAAGGRRARWPAGPLLLRCWSRPLPATELASGGDTRHVYPHPLHLCAARQVSGLVYRRADWQPEARCCRQAPQPRVLPQPRPQVLVTFTVDMVEAQAPSYNSPVTRPSARVNPLQ